MISILQILITTFILLTGCSSTAPTDVNVGQQQPVDTNKVLIVYLSRTNNTKAIAEYIHSRMGGKIVALELRNPYPENYQATVAQVRKENETGLLPPLKTSIDDIEDYDIIFLGFPTWGMQLPPPMKSFLHQYDLSRKTIIPFNTNGGYGIGSSFQTVKQLCPNSKILEGFTIEGGLEKEGKKFVIKGEKAKVAQAKVDKWLKKINLM